MIRIIEFGEKTTKFILLNGDEVTIDNNQKLTRNSEGSEEQFNNILSILIETPIPCTDIPKLERKEDSGNKTNLVRMSMFIPEKTNTSNLQYLPFVYLIIVRS